MIWPTADARYMARLAQPSTVVRFTVEGQPTPKGRPRVGKGGHAYTPHKTRMYETSVKWAARQAMGPRDPMVGDVALELRVYCRDGRRGDLDNYVKALADGMNGIVYDDDRQVVRYTAELLFDKDNPRAEIVARAA